MWPAQDLFEDIWTNGSPPAELARQRGEAAPPPKPRGRPHAKGKKAPIKKAPARPGRRPVKRRRTDSESEVEDDKPVPKNTYPVILTTYEMIIRDQKYLCAYSWGFIVVGKFSGVSPTP
jgi:ATP-dependent DNA helicase